MSDPQTPPPTDKVVPVAANTGAVAVVGLDLQEGKVILRKRGHPSVGAVGLGDATVQQRHPHVRLHGVVSDRARRSYRLAIPRLPVTKTPLSWEHRRALAAPLGRGLGIAVRRCSSLSSAPVLGPARRHLRAPQVAAQHLHWPARRCQRCSALFFVQASPAFFVLGISLIAIGSVLQRDRRGQLQRDARAGLRTRELSAR